MAINRTVYRDRMNEDYLHALSESLEIQNLINAATPINDPNYERLIQIDFIGIAGTTLLIGDTPRQREIQNKLEQIIENEASFKKQKIRVRIRFLLLYLYSDFSHAQIEAELTPNRSTIDNKTLRPNENVFTLNSQDFFSSSSFKHQRQALERIEKLRNDYLCRSNNFDLLNLRFTCLPLNFCMLRVNDTVYQDTYSYSRATRHSDLHHNTPLIKVSGPGSAAMLDIFDDHFKYMWNHPTTLFFEDATYAKIDKKNGNAITNLREIKEPEHVRFDRKARRIKEKNHIALEDKVNRWQFRVEKMFYYMTRIIKKLPDTEELFIGYSFLNGKDVADSICSYLKADFKDCLKVNIVDMSKATKSLYNEVTDGMRASTMGLLFLPSDIHEINDNLEGYYSKPNVYFELGFLMSHVEKYGNPSERIILFADKKLTVPSDFNDFGRYSITGKLQLDYLNILERLLRINRSLTQTVAENAILNFCTRLQEDYNSELIGQSDLPKNKKFGEYAKEIKMRLTSIVNERFADR